MTAEEIETVTARIGIGAEDDLEVEAEVAAHLGAADENIEGTKTCKHVGANKHFKSCSNHHIHHISIACECHLCALLSLDHAHVKILKTRNLNLYNT